MPLTVRKTGMPSRFLGQLAGQPLPSPFCKAKSAWKRGGGKKGMDGTNGMADRDTCTHFKTRALFRVSLRAGIAFVGTASFPTVQSNRRGVPNVRRALH